MTVERDARRRFLSTFWAANSSLDPLGLHIRPGIPAWWEWSRLWRGRSARREVQQALCWLSRDQAVVSFPPKLFFPTSFPKLRNEFGPCLRQDHFLSSCSLNFDLACRAFLLPSQMASGCRAVVLHRESDHEIWGHVISRGVVTVFASSRRWVYLNCLRCFFSLFGCL